jgi:SAM-dependent methyltransferase
MFEFHADRKVYLEHQIQNTQKSLIPFIEQTFPLRAGMRVLEVGCGEGGVLKAFIERGCIGLGVDLAEGRIAVGREMLAEDIALGRIAFEVKNIYDTEFQARFHEEFDLIILKDVIEHIPDQGRLLTELRAYLKPSGRIFFGFPPWYMPFGGHQQMLHSKFLSRLPYFHLLPSFLYKGILKLFGESQPMVDEMLSIKATGISIERFERLVRQTGYRISSEAHYLINPIYEYKFGWKARLQWTWLRKIYFLRNFFTTGVYYLIQKNETK